MNLKLLLTCFFIATALSSFGQTAPAATPRIKIVLIGTFHFSSTSDQRKTSFPDLFSLRRQAELRTLTAQLARLKPDKFFVENEPSRQAYWDSVYARFRQNPADTSASRRNEIVQLAMRTAQQAGLLRVTCVDYQQALPYDKLQAFDKRTEHDSTVLRKMAAYKLLAQPYPYPKFTQKLADHTLSDFLLYVNSPAYDASNRADYFVYAPAAGYDNDYTGVEFITSWYDRNAKIFTNILRQTAPTDKVCILLFGSAHMLPLRHYFQNHPLFEVVELADVLQPATKAKPNTSPHSQRH